MNTSKNFTSKLRGTERPQFSKHETKFDLNYDTNCTDVAQSVMHPKQVQETISIF